MIHHHSYKKGLVALLALGLSAAVQVHAQTGGFGALFGGGGTGNATRRSSSGATAYSGPSQIGDATISVNAATRSIVVIADEQTRANIESVIKSMDIPKPQVLIKVVFMEVTHNNSSDIGIEGGVGNKDLGAGAKGAAANSFGLGSVGSAATSNALVNMFNQPVSSFTPVPPGAGVYSVLASDFQVTLRAIAQAGNAKVLSRPSIVARNNQPATITVGQSVPLINGTRVDNYGNVINSFSYTSVGIILQVTPFITRDGMVEMIVQPQISDLVADHSQWVPISSGSAGNASAPIINTRSADTVVCIPDGQTVIIGGMMQDTKSDSEGKIPLLGDIPLLGNLFKHKIKSDSKTELLIFLTPHIMQAPSEMAAMTKVEGKKFGTEKSLSEQELNKYLDTMPQKAAPDDKTQVPEQMK